MVNMRLYENSPMRVYWKGFEFIPIFLFPDLLTMLQACDK